MSERSRVKAPFFEIAVKSYLYGDDVLELALAADAAAEQYGVDVIFSAPYVEIRRLAERTKHLRIFAPHMDAITPGRGAADVLAEGLAAAGAAGVVLNHCEKPLTLAVLGETLRRARQVGLQTIVCASSVEEAALLAKLGPDIILTEPTELVGSGETSSAEYVEASIRAVKEANPAALVLQGAGIKCYDDVYRMIFSGAEGTGAASGIAALPTREERAAMAVDMIRAVREAYDAREAEKAI